MECEGTATQLARLASVASPLANDPTPLAQQPAPHGRIQKGPLHNVAVSQGLLTQGTNGEPTPLAQPPQGTTSGESRRTASPLSVRGAAHRDGDPSQPTQLAQQICTSGDGRPSQPTTLAQPTANARAGPALTPPAHDPVDRGAALMRGHRGDDFFRLAPSPATTQAATPSQIASPLVSPPIQPRPHPRHTDAPHRASRRHDHLPLPRLPRSFTTHHDYRHDRSRMRQTHRRRPNSSRRFPPRHAHPSLRPLRHTCSPRRYMRALRL